MDSRMDDLMMSTSPVDVGVVDTVLGLDVILSHPPLLTQIEASSVIAFTEKYEKQN